MDNQLLVRVYNVGFGACTYLRVPDKERYVHILIDCGNKFGDIELLGERINDLKKELPVEGNKKCLDLLVVTHPHEDHHKGFEEEYFSDIKIKNIWLSPAYDRENPRAKGLHALKGAVSRALNSLEDFSKTTSLTMAAEIQDLLSLSKSEALKMLNSKLPARNGIKPFYATADAKEKYPQIFSDPDIKIKVLGPMSDIDGIYLGGKGLMNTPEGLTSLAMAEGYASVFPDPSSVKVKTPQNISSQDFKVLRDRVYANGLAAAEMASHIENNLSIVLLLEWHGKRLLFSGDAEWCGAHQGAVQPCGCNGSWNVMWQEYKNGLSAPLDFIQVGHHGSENATPWTPKDHPINEIFDKLLPRPKAGEIPRTVAVVSTSRTKSWPTIPSAPLLEEIGKRVANSCKKYVETVKGPKSVKPGISQPQRTDLDKQTGGNDQYIEIKLKP